MGVPLTVCVFDATALLQLVPDKLPVEDTEADLELVVDAVIVELCVPVRVAVVLDV